jgi:hypothetical protein
LEAGFAGPIVARFGAKGEAEAIPTIDRHDGDGKIGKLFVCKMRFDGCVDGIRHVAFRQLRKRFGPFERGTFAIGIEWGRA